MELARFLYQILCKRMIELLRVCCLHKSLTDGKTLTLIVGRLNYMDYSQRQMVRQVDNTNIIGSIPIVSTKLYNIN